MEDRDALREAVAQQDRDRLQALAHRLAGTAPSFGLTEVGEAARMLDELLQGGAGDGEVEEAARKLIGLLGRCEPQHD